jgi:hypothetical protein
VAKNGSFDFAEGLALRVGAKANVPLWVGNCFKKCAVGKK